MRCCGSSPASVSPASWAPGITLVSEIMPVHTRGYGTMIVATVGILGAVAASLVGDCLRLAHCLLRRRRHGHRAPGAAHRRRRVRACSKDIRRAGHVGAGNFLSLFSSPKTRVKYLRVVLIGGPIWYVVGILVTFSPEFGVEMGMPALPSPGRAVLFAYVGLAIGDFASGALSQVLRSRNRVVALFLTLTTVFVGAYFAVAHLSLTVFYCVCLLLGVATGYWAVFVTIASEQFGTNIRATVTTTAPNFVRGSVVLMTSAFQALQAGRGHSRQRDASSGHVALGRGLRLAVGTRGDLRQRPRLPGAALVLPCRCPRSAACLATPSATAATSCSASSAW